MWYNAMYSELYHHGIAGQKWGEQNGPPYPLDKKVSLAVKRGMTPKEIRQMKKDEVSKEREAQKQAEAKKKALEKARAAKAKKKADAEKEAKRQEKEAARQAKRKEKILSDPSKLYKHRKEFTREELTRAMETFRFENDLAEISAKRVKRGADFSKNLVLIGTAGITGWNMVASIYNGWNEYNKTGQKKLPQLKFENAMGKVEDKDQKK